MPDTIGSFLSRSMKQHRHYFRLYDYLRRDEREIERLVFEDYRWERAIEASKLYA